MQAFSPGTSPPPVRMPIFTATGYGAAPVRPGGRRLSLAHARGPDPGTPGVAGGDLPRPAADARGSRGGVRAVRDRPAVPQPGPADPPLVRHDLRTGGARERVARLLQVRDHRAALPGLDEPHRGL